MKLIKSRNTRIALALSAILLIIWAVTGTGTSLAWFKDATPVQKNVFNVGELDLTLTYKTAQGYKDLTAAEDVFDRNAIYEPGYTQVAYLQIENTGEVEFDYKTAVTVYDQTPGVNVYGTQFNLSDNLRFGVVSAKSEAELDDILGSRDKAQAVAERDLPLNTFTTDDYTLQAGEKCFVALIVYMPEETTNIANYRNVQPYVELGINVTASQSGTLN